MLIILAVSMMAGGKLKFVGFPELDGDVVEARILLPQGTPLLRTESVVERLESALAEVNKRYIPDQPDGQDLVRNITVIYGQNPDAYETGPHVARVGGDLLAAEMRNTTLDDFFKAWRESAGDFTDVIAIKFTEPVIGPGGRPTRGSRTCSSFPMPCSPRQAQATTTSVPGLPTTRRASGGKAATRSSPRTVRSP